ncbi:MAG TPA: hemerythrin domain-containing protein [Chloroflexota bacterium]|jgi:hemerythrin superfamily protein|nr:hemerythrin domain-containing protein [Chloroflexota bacterium]
MDVLEFLTDEHDEAKAVFRKLEKAEGAQASKLFEQLKSMLTLHEEMEETYFYPKLKEEKATEEIVLEGYQEHHVMDLLIEELSELKPSAEVWAPKIKVLQENTEHHIEEEEGELFPKVRKIWNADKREQVGRQMQTMKAKRHEEQQAA